jgi:hypothetical protein
MTLPAEAARSIYGAWRLANLDTSAVGLFNTTVEGAWRSFFAAVIVAPLFFSLIAMGQATEREVFDPTRYWTAEVIAYVISWTAYPVIMALVAESLGRRERFVPYLVVYNWAAVIQAIVFVPINMLQTARLVSPDIGTLLWLTAFMALCAYLWFIARTMLQVTPISAMAIVTLDIILSVVIAIVASGFY